jgi:IQ calmodulin-binding motif
MAAFQLAAIKIQKVIRGHLSRKGYKSPASKPKKSLKQKFISSVYYKRPEEINFKHFCALKIQAAWRSFKLSRRYTLTKHYLFYKAAIVIQTVWRYQRMARQQNGPLSIHQAALKVQRAWRSYTNTKIFRYYKELIRFKLKGNPKELLKTINPSEAHLIDKASNVHLRFRLGGYKFPPLIYYKIYIHSGVVDVNSFAPRDYEAMKKASKKTTINIKFEDEDVKAITTGWYERSDNNGWRPITENIIIPFDKVELQTSNKPVPFHHDKNKRREAKIKQKRKKKIVWLKKLYNEGKKIEEMELQHEVIKKIPEFEENGEVDPKNPFDDEKLLDLNEDELNEYVNGLMKWSETLDFDSYVDNWFQIATSGPIESETTEDFQDVVL